MKREQEKPKYLGDDVQVDVDETTLSIKMGDLFYQYSLDCVETEHRLRHKLTKKEQKLLKRTLTGGGK